MSISMKSQIQEVLSHFLKECDIKFPRDVKLDQSYRDACYADAVRRGFDLTVHSKSLDVGIAIGDTSYRHLGNYSTRVFVGVWTGLMVYIDDCCEEYADGLSEFSSRLMRQEKQMYPVLDKVVEMNRELGEHWSTISVNIILGSELDFFTSTMIDSAIEGMELKSKLAPGFPQFTRRMSGESSAFCVQVFPPELDIKAWIQVIPDLWHFIDHANDLLSFYKEELEGESVNFITMSANENGISKIEALKQLADTTAECYQRGVQLLKSCPEALNAFQSFCVGFFAFHSLSVRYKLNDLDL